MLDFNAPEFLVVAVIALLVIGPKELPKAMRFVGKWMGRARGIARQFRSGLDNMVREAELAEMEKKWAAENERIMREHPAATLAAPEAATANAADVSADAAPTLTPQPDLSDPASLVPSPSEPQARLDLGDAPAAPGTDAANKAGSAGTKQHAGGTAE